MLTPFRMDTNSLYLTEQLNLLGVDVIFKSIVGDDLRRLVAAAQHGLFRSETLAHLAVLRSRAHYRAAARPSARTQSAIRGRGARATARQSSPGISRHPHAENRHAGRVASRRPSRAHLQALHRRGDHDPG